MVQHTSNIGFPHMVWSRLCQHYKIYMLPYSVYYVYMFGPVTAIWLCTPSRSQRKLFLVPDCRICRVDLLPLLLGPPLRLVRVGWPPHATCHFLPKPQYGQPICTLLVRTHWNYPTFEKVTRYRRTRPLLGISNECAPREYK